MDYLCLFANCIPVQGHKRSILCDLQKNRYKIIPNELYSILININQHPYETFLNSYPDKEGLELFIKKLIEEDFVFFTDLPRGFPKLSMEWDTSSIITNAILDLDVASSYNISSFIVELEALGCRAIEIRCFDDSLNNHISAILDALSDSPITTVSILVAYSSLYNLSYFENICNINPRLNNFIIHSSPFFQEKNIEDKVLICYSEEKVASENHCGFVNTDYFTVNIPFFTEAQLHNTCLNRKIVII
jgi:SPASM domain peptide maturase of grasp-with-spasm system